MNKNQPVTSILVELNELLSSNFLAMNDYIRLNVQSDVPLINTLGDHILQSGGKRIRPMLVFLIAQALGACTQQHVRLATIIEFIHTATLLHDDIVDEAHLRRGHKTANFIWGNGAAVLVGDFLYSRSFQMMVDIGEMAVMQELSHTTNKLAEGEVLQLINCGDVRLTRTQYYDVIERKTAKLFASAAKLSALLAGKDALTINHMSQLGLSFGIVYQLMDDVLDYQGDSLKTGKKIGKDLAEGKMTLPLIYALEHTHDQSLLLRAIQKKKIKVILKAIHETQAIDYMLQEAKVQVQACRAMISELAPTPYQQALFSLIDFMLQRQA